MIAENGIRKFGVKKVPAHNALKNLKQQDKTAVDNGAN